jgi:CubicO group peptidase (beta-lactamase class C family)
MPLRLAAVWCLLLPVGGAGAQEPAPAPAPQPSLEAALAAVRARHDVPALGCAVLVDGEVAAIAVDGIRRVGHEQRVTVDDRWHLGSCTKAMTATWIQRFVERGELTWATTVAEGLPDLAERMHEEARTITLEHLVTHRSGLPGGPPAPLWGELFAFAGTDAEARTEVAATMLAVAPEAAPGTRYLYSNAGYMIAGAIVERRAGGDWASSMRRELFAPLGITTAGFGMPGREGTTEQPWGHKRAAGGSRAIFADNPPSLGPAGTAHMTLADWAKFVALHLGVAGDPPLLRPESLARLHTAPAGADDALGWRVTERRWAPGKILTHAGSNTMWFCVAWLAPEARFAVLVTCNHGDGAAACDDVAAECIRRFAAPAARGR